MEVNFSKCHNLTLKEPENKMQNPIEKIIKFIPDLFQNIKINSEKLKTIKDIIKSIASEKEFTCLNLSGLWLDNKQVEEILAVCPKTLEKLDVTGGNNVTEEHLLRLQQKPHSFAGLKVFYSGNIHNSHVMFGKPPKSQHSSSHLEPTPDTPDTPVEQQDIASSSQQEQQDNSSPKTSIGLTEAAVNIKNSLQTGERSG